MSEKSTYAEIEAFKTRIIDSTLLIGTTLGLVAFINSHFPFESDYSFNFYTDLISFIGLFVVSAFKHRINSQTKAMAVILALLGFILTNTVIWGMYSLNRVLIIIIPFYALLVFKFWETITIYIISISAYLSIGVLHINGVLNVRDTLYERLHLYTPWIDSAIIMSVAAFVIVIFTKRYNDEIVRLIGDLKNKNEDLAEREKRLEVEQTFTMGLFESLPGIFNLFKKTDDGYQLVKWNKNTLDVSGLTDEELMGQDPFYVIHPDHRDTIKKVVENIQNGVQAGDNAKSWNAKDNKKSSWFYFTGHPIHYSDGDYFIGLGIDISAQKSVESSFRKEKRFSDRLLDVIPGVFYLYERKGNTYSLSKWNKNLEKATGYTSEELTGKSPYDFFTDEYHGQIRELIPKLSGEEILTFEAPIKKKNELADYWYFVNKKVVDHDREYLIGIGTDIADRKVMERELEHRNYNLRDMLSDMQLRNQKLAEYAFINSHLLRAPLARVLGLAEMVSKQVIISEHQELLENFKTSAEELDAIVSKINDTLDQRRDLNREDILDALSQLNKKSQKTPQASSHLKNE